MIDDINIYSVVGIPANMYMIYNIYTYIYIELWEFQQ